MVWPEEGVISWVFVCWVFFFFGFFLLGHTTFPSILWIQGSVWKTEPKAEESIFMKDLL